MTQIELAEKANCSTRSIQNYETKKRTPDIEIVKRISKALGKKVDEIF